MDSSDDELDASSFDLTDEVHLLQVDWQVLVADGVNP